MIYTTTQSFFKLINLFILRERESKRERESQAGATLPAHSSDAGLKLTNCEIMA